MLSSVANPGLFPVQPALLNIPLVTETDKRVATVLSRLPAGAPFWTPAEIAPIVGITADAFRKHCRAHRLLKNHSANYRFWTDDPDLMLALREVLKVVLWSGLKLPQELRATGRVH